MNKPPKEIEKALTAVLRRLAHLKANWEQANRDYFEPSAFLIALQNCITTSRSVTFILQSHKAAIPDFETWYAPFVEEFKQDPIMGWAKDARNKIEKQGDLETLSQVRAELIASYFGNPKTEWLPSCLVWGAETFRRNIPKKLMSEHVVENGALAIERRWIDAELPDYEVLDALAHVYGQLALMVVSLHEHCRVEIPEKNNEMGEHLLRDLLPDGRLVSMARPFEDRGIYVAVRDGAILGYRREFGKIDVTKAEKALKRYGNNRAWENLTEAKTLLDVAHIYFQTARAIMVKDGYHQSMFIPLIDNRPANIIQATPLNRIDKYLLIRDITHHVRRVGANGLIHISEAWTAAATDIPKGKFAVNATTRGEALGLAAVNAMGEQIRLSATITRKRWKKWKVKELSPTEVAIGGRLISMAPVLEIWGKLDVLNLCADDELMRWADQHFRG